MSPLKFHIEKKEDGGTRNAVSEEIQSGFMILRIHRDGDVTAPNGKIIQSEKIGQKLTQNKRGQKSISISHKETKYSFLAVEC